MFYKHGGDVAEGKSHEQDDRQKGKGAELSKQGSVVMPDMMVGGAGLQWKWERFKFKGGVVRVGDL